MNRINEMKKTSILLLLVICVSSIGIVSAVTPQAIDFVSQIALMISPSTSIVQPTIPSGIPTTSVSTNTNPIIPSTSEIIDQDLLRDLKLELLFLLNLRFERKFGRFLAG